MKRFWFILFLGAALFFKPLAAQQVILDAAVFNPEVNEFYLSSLLQSGGGFSPDVYQISLQNNSEIPVTIRLFLELRRENEILVSSASNIFTLPPLSRNQFRQRELHSGTAQILNQNHLPTGERVEWQVSRMVSTGSVYGEPVLETGKLPAGSYLLASFARVFENGMPAGADIPDGDRENNHFRVSNPGPIHLLYPGAPLSDEDVPEIATLLPQFLWQAQGEYYNLVVYRRQEEDRNAEDVFSHDPVLKVNGLPAPVFQYPAAPDPQYFSSGDVRQGKGFSGAVRHLQPGEVYYWRVERDEAESPDRRIGQSEVFRFKIASHAVESEVDEMTASFLRQVFGSASPEILYQLRGYKATGVIWLDNIPIPAGRLPELARRLQSQQIKIKDITVR
ncbi:MAG: hypothetical protein WAN36_16025 [Calditrichia bacterium]